MSKEKNKKKRKKKGVSPKTQVFMICTLLLGAVFLPTTVLLTVGMLPTVVAFLVDRSRKKTQAVTIGAMNLAGCSPFFLQMWAEGQSFETAVFILMNPTSIIIMYSAAAIGYLLDWSVSGVVASVLYQKGVMRQAAIAERQQDLVERWGEEVTGRIPLDPQGFPLKPYSETAA